MKEIAKARLSELINRYRTYISGVNRDEVSEETIRTWLNEFLSIFGWNVQDTNEVLQERVLSGGQRMRLESICSSHKKPDYILRNGNNIKTFLDAKSIAVNIFSDRSAAYQIRSYGWSAQSPCAFVSNFEQFVIFDTRYIPVPNQPAEVGTRKFKMDEYIENFDVIFEHLWRESVWNNHLDEIYEMTGVEGNNRLDETFMKMLSEFRKTLADNLVKHNKRFEKDDVALNYYVQVILDRIIFIRVCESRGIEEQEKLNSFVRSPDGFWTAFKNSCYMEFHKHYDGAMFERDPRFQRLIFDNHIFNEFVKKLYYPYPYKFDVIPVKVIAKIYEEFLGKQITCINGTIEEIIKSEYIQANGAISTPEHIVEMICKKTISIDHIQTVIELLNTKILDPCCGSGVFLVSCYDMLYKVLVEILKNSKAERSAWAEFYFEEDGLIHLTIEGRREIATKCLHGIDYDDSAIEVAKMSLALKVIDCDIPALLTKMGVFGDLILKDISKNIKLGNTLVDIDAELEQQDVEKIKPYNIKKGFDEVFSGKGGFDYIIGNPPYVETKHFKLALPAMHTYISDKYKTFEGKADLSNIFIERCLGLLNNQGRLGFIVQRRWFKADYGNATRNLIDSNLFKLKQMDFRATNIFSKRITYVSVLVLTNSPNQEFEYSYINDDSEAVKTNFENSDDIGRYEGFPCKFIPNNGVTDQVWAYESYEVKKLQDRLAARYGTIANYHGLHVKDGIQALWKKIYHLTGVTFNDNVATGLNGFGEEVQVERKYLRAVIYNKVFYPFKNVVPNAYCIFPYSDNNVNRISMQFIRNDAPLLYAYLNGNKERIIMNVKHRSNDEYWHIFTREHNHSSYYIDKIIIPMTARDTIATYISGQGLYMDNANVWFITVGGASATVMKTIACIINSTVFSVLAKAGANPQSGGYYKFNRQFIDPVAFPCNFVTEDCTDVAVLSALYDEIAYLQNTLISAVPTRKEVISRVIEAKWCELDDICSRLYQLTDDEIALINGVGRTVSRVELLNGAE
ncbi:MAG: DNA methyltransferase [Acidaminococcaceae bacterium]